MLKLHVFFSLLGDQVPINKKAATFSLIAAAFGESQPSFHLVCMFVNYADISITVNMLTKHFFISVKYSFVICIYIALGFESLSYCLSYLPYELISGIYCIKCIICLCLNLNLKSFIWHTLISIDICRHVSAQRDILIPFRIMDI